MMGADVHMLEDIDIHIMEEIDVRQKVLEYCEADRIYFSDLSWNQS
jgi:hypothetical protein